MSEFHANPPVFGLVPPSEIHMSKLEAPVAISVVPIQSRLPFCFVFGSLRLSCSRMNAMMVNGSITQKFQCQLKASVSQPPRSGDPSWDTSMMAPSIPMYFPRSRGETMSAMTTCEIAISPPMDSPDTALHAMSQVAFSAKPAISEAIAKMPSAIWRRSFLLRKSPSFAHTGVDTAMVSRAAVMIQVYSVWVPWRSEMITGMEVLTMVEAVSTTNMAVNSPLRALRISPRRDFGVWGKVSAMGYHTLLKQEMATGLR